MSMAALEHDARHFARALEDRERCRHGLTRLQAREDVARKVGLPAGTLEGVAKRRIKDPLRLRGLYDRLRAAVIRDLNEEIQRLTHERDLLLATGVDPRSDEVAAATAHLAEAKALLGIEG